ncbi:dynein axonemal intermediate chain 3 [Prionailurus iriomotensis]
MPKSEPWLQNLKNKRVLVATKTQNGAKPNRYYLNREEVEPVTMESMGHPEIYPLVLTTQTQEIFNCRIDEDVTDEKPYKLIKKEDILADFKNRAAVSDFYPVKKVIQEYPGDDLLVVYDKDFRYGLNFYLIGTEEGKENYLNRPEVPEEQEEYKEHTSEDLYIYKPPISKPWVSLGSEKEIDEESVKESTKQITYMISRKRSEFGAPVKFRDQNASSVKDAYIECTAYPDKNFIVKQLEKDVGMQVVPKVKDTSTQTRWAYPKNASTQYYPREFSEEEKEIFGQSKSLIDFLNNASISALQQNEIMNTFIDDWKCLAEEEGTFGDKTDTHLKEYQSFTDLHNLTENMVTSISWHPTIYALMLESPDDIFCFKFCPSDPNIIAGGCINGQIVLWDITAHADRIENIKTGGSRSKKATLKAVDAAKRVEERFLGSLHSTDPPYCTALPQLFSLSSNSPLTKTRRDVPMFLLEPDSNKEAMYIRHCAVSSIENGHKKVITDIHWLSDTFEINRMGSVFENRSGICCQLVTCSADCTICFWDIRSQKALTPPPIEKKKEESIEIPFDVPSTFLHLDLSWKPLIKIRLSKAQDKILAQSKVVKAGEMNPYHDLEGALANNLKPIEDFCTKFFVGTEEGGVIYTDWKMERDPETGRLMAKKPVNLYAVHDGAVHTVQRSPFYKDIILTIGGWNLAIWKEGITTGPLLQSCCAPKRYTAGHWSLTRPGVFYIGREDGYIDIWDLLEKTQEPAQSQNICITMITYIKPWTFTAKQQFIAIADYYGTLHILEIPWTLSHPSANEASSMSYYFEREVKHLEYVEQRKKIREQEKKEMELEREKKKTKTYQKSKEQMEAELKADYDNYLELEKNTLINLGLIKVPEMMSFMDLM